MATPQSYPVGQAPWEQQSASAPKAGSYPVGSAPWETPDADQPAEAPKQSVPWYQIENPTARKYIQSGLNMLPTAGMVGGAVVGGTGGTALEPGGGTVAGGLAGSALGSAGGESLKNLGEQYLLGQDKTRGDIYGGPLRAAADGATAEMGGQILGKGIGLAADTPAGQYVLRKAGDAASSAKAVPQWAAQKVGSAFFDVPEATTARYLANPDAINAAPARDAISDQLLDLKSKATDSVAKAQEELQDAKSAATDSSYDTRANIQDQKFSASNDAQQAQQNLNDKKQAFKESLKAQNLTSMAGDVHDAMGDLKSQVVQGSKDAYDTLSQSNGEVETKPLVNLLENHIQAMHVNGVPDSGSAGQAIAELRATQDRLSQMGDTLTMPEAKQIMQGIDRDITPSPYGQPAKFADQTTQGLSALRTAIDTDVKTQVPAYRDQMLDVSRKARLLNAADEHFGTIPKAIGNLNNIASPRGQTVHVPIIEALGQETGKNLSAPVQDFLVTHKILNTPSLFEHMVSQMPEAGVADAAQAKAASLSDPAYTRTTMENAAAAPAAKIDSAQAALDEAKQRANLFSGVTPDSITSKTKALNGANSYGAEAKFGPIDEAHGTDFQNQIQNRNDLDQFSKDSTNGSRKAFMGGALGAGLGGMVAGGEGALVGETLGSQVGGVLDKYGGKIFKKSLGAGMKVGDAAVGAGQVLKQAPSITGEGVASMVPNNMAQMSKAASTDDKKGPDKWANDGLQNLKSHVEDADKKFLDKNKGAMMLDPKAKQLLITASNYEPGSKPLDDVMGHLKNKFGSGK